MPSHGRHRRHRGNKAQDEDRTLLSRDDDLYSRSRQSDEYRRHSSGSTRGSYDVNPRETSSSSRVTDSWQRSEPYDRDRFQKGGRDDYEPVESRELEGWANRRANNDALYSHPQREEWPPPPRYDSNYSSTSYPEQYPPPSNSYSQWPEEPRPFEERALDHNHPPRSPEESRWRRDSSRSDRTAYPPESDNGWETRRSENARRQSWDEPSTSRFVSPPVDRQWEPAPGWKSSHRNDSNYQRSNQQNGHRGVSSNKRSSKNGKKSHSNGRSNGSKRDWREEDDLLNNWSRRDDYPEERYDKERYDRQSSSSRRKHGRSYSRSRSPADSYYSHRSQGRSPSLPRASSPYNPPGSPPPTKRRKRNSRSPSPRSRSPGHRDRRGSRWTPPPKRTPSPIAKWENGVYPDPSRSPTYNRRPETPPAYLSPPTNATQPLPPVPTDTPLTADTVSEESLLQPPPKQVPQDSVSQHLSNPPKSSKSKKKKRKQAQAQAAAAAASANSEQRPPPRNPPRVDDLLVPDAYGGYYSYPPLNHPLPAPLPTISQLSRPLDQSSLPAIPSPAPPPSLPAIPPPAAGPTLPSRPASSTPSLPAHPAYLGSANATPVSDLPAQTGSYGGAQNATTPVPGSFVPIRNIASRAPKSALKHFFPGFTEDEEQASNTSETPPAQPQTQAQTESQAQQAPSANQDSEVQNQGDHLNSTHASNAPHFVPSSAQIPPPSPDRSSVSDQKVLSKEPTPTPAPPSLHEEPCTPAFSSTPAPRPELYSIVGQVGEGTFGKVYKARNTMTNMHVALKRIRMESERDGFPVTAMREIKLLQSLRHDNVVRLYEMMVSTGSVYMVFEYMDHDLTGVLSQTQFEFSEAHLKSLCHQMFKGLGYLHHKGVIHRDIKGSNILINNRGELKLADFGLARFYHKRRRTDYTNRVITLWYRPPELLFGATVYGPEVDMWSAGCIMLELYCKKPVFQGNDEISQLDVIYKVIGTPTLQRWSGFANLPWYELVKPKDAIPNRFRDLFRKWMSPSALDLAERLLDYDPAQRITAAQAMEEPYFLTEPKAERPTSLATLEGEWHELETKRERARRKKRE